MSVVALLVVFHTSRFTVLGESQSKSGVFTQTTTVIVFEIQVKYFFYMSVKTLPIWFNWCLLVTGPVWLT